LAEHFLRRIEPKALPLPAATVSFLTGQAWPGNVRELRNALEHAVIVSRGGPLLPEHFPLFPSAAAPVGVADQLGAAVRRWLAERIKDSGAREPADLYGELLKVVEPALLDDLIRRVDGNRQMAARWLGLNRATVRKLLAKYFPLTEPLTPED
jgi:two-component system nitrogen regulation response regulator GlnG